MVIERPVAAGRGGAGEVERAHAGHSAATIRRADRLDDAGSRTVLLLAVMTCEASVRDIDRRDPASGAIRGG